MLGREFVKRIRLLMGRTETVKTRFDLDEDGALVEHVIVETHDKPNNVLKSAASQGTPDSSRSGSGPR
jgi:hypothetical protein